MKIDDDLTSQPEVLEIEPNDIFQQEYPKLVERYKAMIADGIVILLGFVLAAIIFSFFENAPVFIRVMSFLFFGSFLRANIDFNFWIYNWP